MFFDCLSLDAIADAFSVYYQLLSLSATMEGTDQSLSRIDSVSKTSGMRSGVLLSVFRTPSRTLLVFSLSPVFNNDDGGNGRVTERTFGRWRVGHRSVLPDARLRIGIVPPYLVSHLDCEWCRHNMESVVSGFLAKFLPRRHNAYFLSNRSGKDRSAQRCHLTESKLTQIAEFLVCPCQKPSDQNSPPMSR